MSVGSFFCPGSDEDELGLRLEFLDNKECSAGESDEGFPFSLVEDSANPRTRSTSAARRNEGSP